MRPLIRRAGTEGPIDPCAQFAILGKGQDRVDARRLQRHAPASLALGLGRRGEHRLVGLRHARQIRLVGDQLFPGIGRIEHRTAEFVGKRRELDRHRLEPLARGLVERHARQAEIAQRVLDRDPVGLGQRGEFGRRGERFEHLVEFAILPDHDAVGDEPLLALLIGGAQLGAIGDRMQVRDRRPDRAELGFCPLEWQPGVGEDCRLVAH